MNIFANLASLEDIMSAIRLRDNDFRFSIAHYMELDYFEGDIFGYGMEFSLNFGFLISE
jgi:hypothetical protein